VTHIGSGGPTHSARDLAQRFLAGAVAGCTDRGLLQAHGIPDLGGYALVARPTTGTGARLLPFIREAARALRHVLERIIRLERQMSSAEVAAAASERRLARIGFDLHDGPVQILAALLADARLLSVQVGDELADEPHRDLVLGRLDDLKAMMVVLEFEMRTLCQSLESPTVLRRPFERVVEQECVSFERATGVRPTVWLGGRFDELTPSQRIALLRVVQEALRNVREHSKAARVSIRIRTGPEGTDAVVCDDGAGFDVEEALARAVRNGRMGLIGMMERLRMLGGTCEVSSKRGGPTTVRAMLPRWRPDSATS
jgi:signal transduction histidine kinase